MFFWELQGPYGMGYLEGCSQREGMFPWRQQRPRGMGMLRGMWLRRRCSLGDRGDPTGWVSPEGYSQRGRMLP